MRQLILILILFIGFNCTNKSSSIIDSSVLGCTDEMACNYDETVDVDDSSCEYAQDNMDCDGNCLVELDCNDVCGGMDNSCLSIDKGFPPTEFEISSIYPNPFNPICQFSIGNPKFNQVEIIIYNIQGQQVSVLYAGSLSLGYHNFHWNAQNFQSGLYFIKVNYDNYVEVMRVLLIK
jgi:hypothetical protein